MDSALATHLGTVVFMAKTVSVTTGSARTSVERSVEVRAHTHMLKHTHTFTESLCPLRPVQPASVTEGIDRTRQ